MLFLTSGALFLVSGSAFKNPQSEGKAVKRLKRALPNSPRKSRQAVRKLAMACGIDIAEEANEDEQRGRKPISDGVLEKVKMFYMRDDISRQAPGTKDCKKVDGQLMQKRHLYSNINETFELYVQEYGGTHSIGRSKFAQLRPSHVLPLSDIPQNVCLFLSRKCFAMSYCTL